MNMHTRTTFMAGIALAATVALPGYGGDLSLNVLGITSTNTTQSDVEVPFFADLAKTTGEDFDVTYRAADVAGVKSEDTLRMVSSDVFDIVQTSVGPVARDDLFLDGLDLVGVSPTLEDLRTAVESYRDVFSQRTIDKFGVRTMALWPYGPQVFYCNGSVSSVADLQGKKVRSYTASMSALVTALGGIPVTMGFPEVYLGLQRGVIDCAITSPTSGNTGKWPEVTENLIPMGINWAMNAHFMNAAKYDAMPPEAQASLTAAFKSFEDELWVLADDVSNQAIACNIGADDCTGFTKYSMNLVEVTDADRAAMADAVSTQILPEWGKTCNSGYGDCTKVWNETVGAARGLSMGG